jgi:alpha-beta hydrolase superfamily lysophospholipase
MMRRALRAIGLAIGSALFGMLLVGLALYIRFLRGGPELEPWHRAHLDEEFTAAQADELRTVANYRALEARLFDELDREVYAQTEAEDRVPYNRYHRGSQSDPATWPIDWNRTWEHAPVAPPAAVLLLHGLTDSPYSLRALGEDLAARGVHVLAPRMPGHGTAPAGLLDFEIEDMQALVHLAMRDLRARLGSDTPIYLVGYSNGAALAVDYALAVHEGADLPRPARLILISPALAVSRLAMVGRVHTGLSKLPGFGRAAWQLIEAEIDPYKYSSFSLHAAGETFRLTRGVARRVQRLAARGAIEGFPPVLAFVSTVDATVRADAVVDALLEHLAPQGHELVLFDVNRLAEAESLLVAGSGPLTRRLLAMPERPFELSVITNANPRSLQVKELEALAGSGRQTARLLALAWPRGVFSLSHVALPFPPDDPLYGYAAPPDDSHVQLGRVEVRGENGVLAVPTWLLTRQRSNPFYSYLEERVREAVLSAPPSPSAPASSSSSSQASPVAAHHRRLPAPAGTPPST